MTREEAAEYFARKRDTLIWGLKDNRDETRQAHDAYNEAIVALCGPRPDPITGLMPCGCGGRAFVYCPVDMTDVFVIRCEKCRVGITFAMDLPRAKKEWNTAMGWRVEG